MVFAIYLNSSWNWGSQFSPGGLSEWSMVGTKAGSPLARGDSLKAQIYGSV